MKKLWIVPIVVVVSLLGFTGQKDTYADSIAKDSRPAKLRALILDGFHQVPPVHTEASGTFKARIQADGTIAYTLTYTGLTAPVHVQFADVHFGQEQNTGAILFFMCSNQATAPTQGNPVSGSASGTDTFGVARTGTQTFFNGPVTVPAGTQTCPDSGTVTGTIGPADIVDTGAPLIRGAQGIRAGELAKVLEAIHSGQTYVQVHTNAYPPGELRRQIEVDGDKD
jgi:hypothetical protein